MKKLSILLALVMLITLLAACNTEGDNAPADFEVPGYLVQLPTGKGWTSVEDTLYDLELTKDGIKLYVRCFNLGDFVDMPLVEDLYIDELDGLLATLTDAAEKEAQSTYQKDGKTIITSLQTGKEGEEARELYCFAVDFGGNSGTIAWVAFSAKADVMSKNKASFKSIVEGMTCTNEFPEDYDPFADELEFDENGELITDETEPEEYFEEEGTEPTETPEQPSEPTDNAVVIETTAAAGE